jgi:hypothetical protein
MLDPGLESTAAEQSSGTTSLFGGGVGGAVLRAIPYAESLSGIGR